MSGLKRTHLIPIVFVVVTGVALCACSTATKTATSTTSASTTSTTEPPAGPTTAQATAEANGAAPADTDRAGVEWLCRPGQATNPCTDPLTATVVPESGPTKVESASDAASPPIDCFYVYPTVSAQQTIVANLHIDQAEIAVARSQASRFSQVCRVFAPMYTQLTLHAILDESAVTSADEAEAYTSVVSAWDDYLANYNDGRGVVLIGHSQGSAMLIALIRAHIDDNPVVRRKLVSAILLGGNVEVPIGKNVGGSFQNIPACRSTTQTGCVVAYSSFDEQPPSNSLFGRAGQGVRGGTALSLPASELQVLCVNPASPSGGSGTLDPYFPSSGGGLVGGLSQVGASEPAGITTPWITEPDLYTGQCMYKDGASWLMVSGPITPGDPRTLVKETIGVTWGLHLVDMNIALGNLVPLVKSQEDAYANS